MSIPLKAEICRRGGGWLAVEFSRATDGNWDTERRGGERFFGDKVPDTKGGEDSAPSKVGCFEIGAQTPALANPDSRVIFAAYV